MSDHPTLADMPLGKGLNTIGTWADINYDDDTHLGVILNIKAAAVIYIPARDLLRSVNLTDVTPRHDLPRAWNTDGTPTRKE